MLLYGHSQDLAAALSLIEHLRPAYWKWVGNDRHEDLEAARRCYELGVRLIVRHYQPAPVYDAYDFVQECRSQPWWAWAWAVETHNEPFSGSEVPDWYVQFEAECVQWFRAFGKECVVGQRANGHDGHFVPGAQYYGTHEYGWPHPWSQHPWRLNRYRSWFPLVLEQNSDAHLFITECGVTQAVVDGPDVGFRADGGPSAEEYWSGLLDYAGQFPPYVLGAFVFQAGAYSDWATFEVLGTGVEHLWQPQPAPAAPPDDLPFVLGPGMRDKATRLGQGITGAQRTGETYLKNPDGTDVYSFAVFEHGELRYYPGTGLTLWFPAQ